MWIPVSLVLGSKKELGMGLTVAAASCANRGFRRSQAGSGERFTLCHFFEESAWEGPLPLPQWLSGRVKCSCHMAQPARRHRAWRTASRTLPRPLDVARGFRHQIFTIELIFARKTYRHSLLCAAIEDGTLEVCHAVSLSLNSEALQTCRLPTERGEGWRS